MILKTQTHRQPGIRSGFTLTELLVVIAISVVVAALSMKLIGDVRKSAARASCASNLRTWGIAIHGHAADNNGLVQWNNWASISTDARFYETHLGGDGVSPSATMDGRLLLLTQLHRRGPGQSWDKVGNGPVGYGMVRPNPKVPNEGTYNLKTADDPSSLLVMIGSTQLYLNGPDDIERAVKPLCVGDNPRHRGTVNALFGDGHVASYSWKELSGGDAQQRRRLERWFTLR